jgi:hypothetical protein
MRRCPKWKLLSKTHRSCHLHRMVRRPLRVQPALSPNRGVVCARHSIAWSSSRTTLSTARMWSRSLLCARKPSKCGRFAPHGTALGALHWHTLLLLQKRSAVLRLGGAAHSCCSRSDCAPLEQREAATCALCACVFVGVRVRVGLLCACACVPWHGIHSHRYVHMPRYTYRQTAHRVPEY